MVLNVLNIIVLVTVVVSILAFTNNEISRKLLYIPYEVKNGNNYTRVFGHMFIHADYMHLGFNMFALYFLGGVFLDTGELRYVGVDDTLVDTYGSLKGQFHFLILYIFGGLFATLIPYLRHHNNPSYSSLGASGAVSSVVFAAIIWNPGMTIHLMFIPFPIPSYIFGPLYLAFEYFADRRGGGNIAHDAHIGGALFGIAYILIINIDKGKEFLSYFI